MLVVDGMIRSKALLLLQREFKTLDIKIGKLGCNRIHWKHEHKGYNIIGEFSPFRAGVENRVMFAIYAREL